MSNLLRKLLPVSGSQYRKLKRALTAADHAYRELEGEKALAERAAHHALGPLATTMSRWRATEFEEVIQIGMEIDKKMATAAMKESPEEFRRFLAQELGSKIVHAFDELTDGMEKDRLKKAGIIIA
tara:strand:+ start:98 stop:475 length:378 start_codon:yes stop_codon:yes gene_type:complete